MYKEYIVSKEGKRKTICIAIKLHTNNEFDKTVVLNEVCIQRTRRRVYISLILAFSHFPPAVELILNSSLNL